MSMHSSRQLFVTKRNTQNLYVLFVLKTVPVNNFKKLLSKSKRTQLLFGNLTTYKNFNYICLKTRMLLDICTHRVFKEQ